MMSVLRIRTKKDFFSFLPVAMVCLLGDRGDGMYRSFKSVTSLLCQSNITFKFHLLFLFPTLMFALKRYLWLGKEGSSCTHTQEPIKRNSQCFDIKKSSETQQVSLACFCWRFQFIWVKQSPNDYWYWELYTNPFPVEWWTLILTIMKRKSSKFWFSHLIQLTLSFETGKGKKKKTPLFPLVNPTHLLTVWALTSLLPLSASLLSGQSVWYILKSKKCLCDWLTKGINLGSKWLTTSQLRETLAKGHRAPLKCRSSPRKRGMLRFSQLLPLSPSWSNLSRCMTVQYSHLAGCGGRALYPALREQR